MDLTGLPNRPSPGEREGRPLPGSAAPGTLRAAMRRLLPLLLVLAALSRAGAQTAEERYRAVFSAAALGEPAASAQLGVEFTLRYRGLLNPAAFALARDAAGRATWGYAGGAADMATAEAVALERCRRGLGTLRAECRILARDATLANGEGVAPAEGSLGPFRWSPLHLRRGAAAARGVVIWGHGYAGPDRDLRRTPTPGFLGILNDAGWDILRFDRHPGDDSLYAALPRLLAGLPAVREAGYRQIILGGQSRGGWQAMLAAAQVPGQVAAVIATAPAAHGEAEHGNTLAAGLEDFRRLLAGLPNAGPRLAVALFDGDGFDPAPAERAAMLDALAGTRAAPTLVLWPDQDIRGHNGAGDWRFPRRFGACLLGLVAAPEAAAPRGLRRLPCGGG